MQPHSTRTPFFPENLDDYAPWVTKHGLVAPYGKCQCGCEQDAPIARRSSSYRGWKRSEPLRYLNNHDKRQSILDEAFWRYVTPGKTDECWEWQGPRFTWGYGNLGYQGQNLVAHRVSYELHYGSIPNELFVCHKCDNPPCVNPNHLFLGTHQDNMDDMTAKGRHHSGAAGKPPTTAKLKESDIPEILKLREAGMSLIAIAQKYGVVRDTIGKIVRGETWGNRDNAIEARKKQKDAAK